MKSEIFHCSQSNNDPKIAENSHCSLKTLWKMAGFQEIGGGNSFFLKSWEPERAVHSFGWANVQEERGD